MCTRVTEVCEDYSMLHPCVVFFFGLSRRHRSGCAPRAMPGTCDGTGLVVCLRLDGVEASSAGGYPRRSPRLLCYTHQRPTGPMLRGGTNHRGRGTMAK